MRVVDTDRRRAVVRQHVGVLIDRRDCTPGGEHAVGHDQRSLPGLEVVSQACRQAFRVSMRESEQRPSAQSGSLQHAVVRELVCKHGVETAVQKQHQHVVAEVAGGEVEGVVGSEELGRATFHVERGRRVSKPGTAGGATDAVPPGGFTGGENDVLMSLQAEVSGAGEVQVAPAVQHGFRARRTVHYWHGRGQLCV